MTTTTFDIGTSVKYRSSPGGLRSRWRGVIKSVINDGHDVAVLWDCGDGRTSLMWCEESEIEAA